MVNNLNFDRSLEILNEAKKSLAGGVNSKIREPHAPHPLFMEKAKGSHIWDVDGNEFIDTLMGFGPIILGYCDPKVNSAVQEQLNKGSIFGMSNELEYKVTEKIVKAIPSGDLAFASNTGSEATQMAIRMARAYTGKEKIIKFEGVWHGWLDWCLVDTTYETTGFWYPHGGSQIAPIMTFGEPGIPKNVIDNLIVLPWNDIASVEKTVERFSSEIAAIIVEPIGPAGGIMPYDGYLDSIRKITKENDMLMILDEVKTGFRLAFGGAQELYGIDPDISTFAKAIANGFPMAAVTGKKKYMDIISQGITGHAGTFNGNPISMAASLATLTELEKPNKYDYLYKLTKKLSRGLKDGISDSQARALLVGPGSNENKPGPILDIYFTDLETVKDQRELKASKKEIHKKMANTFKLEMLKRGIHVIEHVWFVSFSHTDDDIDKIIEAASESMKIVSKI